MNWYNHATWLQIPDSSLNVSVETYLKTLQFLLMKMFQNQQYFTTKSIAHYTGQVGNLKMNYAIGILKRYYFLIWKLLVFELLKRDSILWSHGKNVPESWPNLSRVVLHKATTRAKNEWPKKSCFYLTIWNWKNISNERESKRNSEEKEGMEKIWYKLYFQ